MLPKARTEQLTIEELAEETLLFDHRSGKAHCLNHVSRLIWNHCDGRTRLAELAALVRREFGLPNAEAVVELALEQLAQRRLLEGRIERPSPERRRSRRDLLKKMAVAALTLPAIMTIAAPRASAAASFACTTDAQCSSLTANGGCVVGICEAGRCNTKTLVDLSPCTGCGAAACACAFGACLNATPQNSR